MVITKNGKKIARLTPYVTEIEQYFAAKEKAVDYKYGGKKVSYEEFLVISEKSTLRMELLNGEIFLMASPDVEHQERTGRMYLLFHEYFKNSGCKVFFSPFDVCLKKAGINEPDVLQPDLIVICDHIDNINEKKKYTGTPSLVVEILSDNTRSRDMIDKLNSYMLSGVKEYWLIDKKQQSIMIYEFANYDIESLKAFQKGAKAHSNIFQGLMADVCKLFDKLL